MKHLFVTNDFPPKKGGIESYLLNLCTGFNPRDITVLAPVRDGHAQIDDELLYRVVRYPRAYMTGSRRVSARVTEVVKNNGVDAVHLLHTLPLGRMIRHLRKHLSIPISVFVHGSEVFVPSKTGIGRRTMLKVWRQADQVFAVSKFTAGRVRELSKGQVKAEVIYPTVDHERFSLLTSGQKIRDELGLGSKFVVLFVSRLVKRKGASILLKALLSVPDASAVIVGGGRLHKRLRRLAGRLGVESRTHFLGTVPDSKLPGLYAAADVFCVPCVDRYSGSDTEGFGVVFIEAAACGLPVVTGECGGSVEAVADDESGVILRPATASKLGEVLAELAADEVRRTVLGAAGRRRVEDIFDPNVQAKRLSSLVRSKS